MGDCDWHGGKRALDIVVPPLYEFVWGASSLLVLRSRAVGMVVVFSLCFSAGRQWKPDVT